MDNFDLRKYLAENRLFEEKNPVWVISSEEDSADIEQAGPAYKEAVIDIIKAKHSDISNDDLEKSIEATNDYWYGEARQNAKGSNPKTIKVSAKEFANASIEHYEDTSGEIEDFSGSEERTFDERLNRYLTWDGIPSLQGFSEKYITAFKNYAEKYLKPSNASDEEIKDAILKFRTKHFQDRNN